MKILEHVFREPLRLLHAHTAVAERATRPRTQRVRRRVVQVHVVGIRKQELHMPKRVGIARFLSKHQTAKRVGVVPVHVSRPHDGT